MHGDDRTVGQKLDFIIAELIEQRARQFAIAITLFHMEHRIMSNIDTINQAIGQISTDLDAITQSLNGISADAAAIADLLKNNPTDAQLADAATKLQALASSADGLASNASTTKTALDGLVPPAGGSNATGG